MVSISQMYFANSLLSGNFTPRSSHICLLQVHLSTPGIPGVDKCVKNAV